MKLGKCPRCRVRMVLVKVQRCGCGKGCTKIAQKRQCPLSTVRLVVRRHDCGARLVPVDIRDLQVSA